MFECFGYILFIGYIIMFECFCLFNFRNSNRCSDHGRFLCGI